MGAQQMLYKTNLQRSDGWNLLNDNLKLFFFLPLKHSVFIHIAPAVASLN
jgi:hypothetical protein